MKKITVNMSPFANPQLANNYDLVQTDRRGFYKLDAASFSSIVSKKTTKITGIRAGEDIGEIAAKIERIKTKAFAANEN